MHTALHLLPRFVFKKWPCTALSHLRSSLFLPVMVSPTSNEREECELESLEKVKALVCDLCWKTCFDTKEFERLGRQEINDFTYVVSVPPKSSFI